MSQEIIGKKALVVNPFTKNTEAVFGGMMKGESGYNMVLNFGASYSLVFQDQKEWKKFALWIANLNPYDKEGVILINKPILKKKDLIQWFDDGVGVVVDVELIDKDWVYSIFWQDTEHQTTMTGTGLKDRVGSWKKIN